MQWIVMSAVEITSKNSNRDRCFDLNAVGISTKEEAERIATARNEVERAAGHTNVMWYPVEW
jgi:hypothetical protein